MVKLPSAQTKNGQYVFAHTVDRTIGHFKCTTCRMPVVLRRGKQRTAHFAHKANVSNCSGGGESEQHRATKEWIAANAGNGNLKFKQKCKRCSAVDYAGVSHVPPARHKFTAAMGQPGLVGFAEQRIPTDPDRFELNKNPSHMQPDVTIRDARGRARIYVEVCHTNPKTDEEMRFLNTRSSLATAIEVQAVDLIAKKYPLRFTVKGSALCQPCVRARRVKRVERLRAEKTESIVAEFCRILFAPVKRKRLRVEERRRRGREYAQRKNDERVQRHRNLRDQDDRTERDKIEKRKKMRKCSECCEWRATDAGMVRCAEVPGEQYRPLCCKGCTVDCNNCCTPMVASLAIYGGRCFQCNMRRRQEQQ